MRCLHHIDADGYCAAAIVRYELTDTFDTVLPEHFVEYDHDGVINIDEEKFFDVQRPGYLYIVDLALDQTIFDFIKKCVEHHMMIVHIDHHISGRKFLEETLSDEERIWYKEHVNYFFNNDWSGCMLTYVYSCMTETERAHPMSVEFDFSEDLSQLAINPSTDVRVHSVPVAIRLIDDNDVWRHSLDDSKYFAAAWGIQDIKHPLDLEFWNALLYEGPRKAYNMIEDGKMIFKFMENQSKSVMHNAFEVTIGDYKGIAVNCPFGNSRLFGDAYDQYDFVIKYSQASPDRWKYTIYSREGGADCEELVKKYFNELGLAGGHRNAAGGTMSGNVFDGTTTL